MAAFFALMSLFASSFLAATLLPLSSEAVFLFMMQQNYSVMLCIVVATFGNSLGGLTNLVLGRVSRTFFEKRGPKKPYAERFIHRYGAWVAWLSWVPFIGDPLLVAAGYYRTPLTRTIVFMVTGKTLRYIGIWYFWSLTQ